MARKLVGATAIKWHKILGHAGPNAIRQLPKHINGAEFEELINKRAPLKIKYEVYLLVSFMPLIYLGSCLIALRPT